MRSLVTFLFSTSILVTAGITNAGPNERAKIQLGLTAATITNPCAHKPSCVQIVTDGRLLPSVYYAYLLVTDGDATAGVGGLQCGIEYDGAAGSGVEIYSWTLCADAEAPLAGWPASGGGNRITWNAETNCQMYEPGGEGTGVVTTAGYFYVGAYSRDELEITVRPDDGIASVTDCSGVTDVIQGGDIIGVGVLGSVGFSADQSLPGFNPCGQYFCSRCTIAGDTSVIEGTSDHVYSGHTSVSPITPNRFDWSVTGEATIVGPSNSASVTISAGAHGTFQLIFWAYVDNYPIPGKGLCSVCGKTVQVVPFIATTPTTWSAIKSLYRE